MQKALTLVSSDRALGDELGATSRILRSPGMLDRANRTFICTVLFVDIVEYSKKDVTEQLKLKQQFNACISDAIQDVAANDRIILDTGDGVAINFLGDPEDALFVAMNLSRAFKTPAEGHARVEVRMGINLGPVRLVRDINGQPNIIGDGINVAERVMSFARADQVLVSRAYYDMVARISEDYAQLFAYQGSRTDKHVREHEIYEVAPSGGEALELATRRHFAHPAVGRAALADMAGSAQVNPEPKRKALLGNRALAYGGVLVSTLVLASALALHLMGTDKPSAPKIIRATHAPPKPVEQAAIQVATAAPEPTPVAVEPEKAPEPVKPEKTSEPVKPVPVTRAAPAKVRKEPTHKLAFAQPRETPREARAEVKPQPTPIVEQPAPPPEPAPAPAPVANTAKAPAGPTALVMLAISPWGEVLVDGRPMGVSPPLNELELAPGSYRIEIRNGSFKPYQEIYQLQSNQTIKIKYKFK
jgi:class 3 adenylate cyclase